MMQPIPPKVQARADAKRLWRTLRESYAKAGQLVLEMMRHPDATDEQIAEVHKTYVRIYADIRKTQKDLRDKYPSPYSYADEWAL